MNRRELIKGAAALATAFAVGIAEAQSKDNISVEQLVLTKEQMDAAGKRGASNGSATGVATTTANNASTAVANEGNSTLNNAKNALPGGRFIPNFHTKAPKVEAKGDVLKGAKIELDAAVLKASKQIGAQGGVVVLFGEKTRTDVMTDMLRQANVAGKVAVIVVNPKLTPDMGAFETLIANDDKAKSAGIPSAWLYKNTFTEPSARVGQLDLTGKIFQETFGVAAAPAASTLPATAPTVAPPKPH